MSAPVSDSSKHSAPLLACRIHRQAGFSLVETVITIVVIAISLAAISGSMNLSLKRGADPIWQARAVQMAQSYMEDILALRFQEDAVAGGGAVASCRVDGPENGETSRDDFDDVDDYQGLVEQGQFLDTGALASNQYQITIQISCQAVTVGSTSGFIKQVTLTISGADDASLVMSAVRGNF